MRKILTFILVLFSLVSNAQYKVEWNLVKMIQDRCPDADKRDKFGRLSGVSCDVYHAHAVFEPHDQTFPDSVSANDFIKEAQRQPDITDIRLNGVEVKKKSESIRSFGIWHAPAIKVGRNYDSLRQFKSIVDTTPPFWFIDTTPAKPITINTRLLSRITSSLQPPGFMKHNGDTSAVIMLCSDERGSFYNKELVMPVKTVIVAGYIVETQGRYTYLDYKKKPIPLSKYIVWLHRKQDENLWVGKNKGGKP